MKNLSLVLNLVLLIAVAVLFYLHFHQQVTPAVAETSGPATTIAVPVKPSTIVYVNSDSLLDNYAFLKVKKQDLEARHKKASADLEAEGARLQSDAQAYQQQGASMTDEQRAKTEEQLMARQQQLLQKQKTIMGRFDEEQDHINEELFNKLNAYLKEYNKTHRYEFILGYQKGGGILLANDSLDITKQVLDGLNKKYKEETSSK